MSLGRRVLGTLLLATLGCGREPPQDLEPKPEPRAAGAEIGPRSIALDGALLDGRGDTTALAELAATLPRPTPTGSPLVAAFSRVVAEFDGPASERLAATGLAPDGVIELSIRALDGRAPSARKLLGELVGDEVAPDDPARARLRGQAGTLGLHLRASLPIGDRAKLLATIDRVAGPRADTWASTCGALAELSSCAGPERLLIWARVEGATLQLDAIYLFQTSRDPGELAWVVARADGWAGPATGASFSEPKALGGAFEFEFRAAPMLALLEAEALADAIVRHDAGELDYHAFLDQTQALRDLVPAARVFEGVRTRVAVEASELTVTTAWIAAEHPPVGLAELFGPITERFDLPTIEATCEHAAACARMAGLTLTPRFAPLARGPFADTTGATRVLRQAGERGPILLLLASWPNLLGTAGQMTEAESGLVAEAQAALIDEAYAVGGALLELDPDPTGAADEWAAYLRMGPNAFATVRPLAGLVGLEPRPLALEGVASLVDRGVYEADGESTRIYFVDDRELAGGHGGWLVAGDTDARASWLLTRPRESSTELTTLGFVQIRELGPLAAREAVPFADDPAVRRWLEARSLTIALRLTADGPLMEWRLRRRAP